MNDNEQRLLADLRALSEDGPRQAPDAVEQRLVGEFRRRRASLRRRNLLWSISSIAAVAAGIAIGLWIRPLLPSRALPESATLTAQAVVSDAQESTSDFYPLPEAEALPPVENAVVVRLELPMASLRLIGFPVNEERAGERIEADVLLGQDGLARGVRLVQ